MPSWGPALSLSCPSWALLQDLLPHDNATPGNCLFLWLAAALLLSASCKELEAASAQGLPFCRLLASLDLQ